ncbi:protein-cysteine N-palmitoyltransferase HHAT isoform X2 [Synchiropus splendidus]|uniref:protein-cysteine N-palmitoyltransferase HHAT isoform X2 n=1 Tax=Synchiropus splendidus TaxID=270530 RepID=UPI00237EC3B8|nr:protein-cysteine N-palmitoyltransferase HHAT isoform X2 [Synchiropus splendidus]XP_053730799.1 protein-cysteine N-palmitoyltransferase HHAT isoform X2 [Synchiropus splendidus]XP_053730800.1 protein-cysteine N-palmitoyltransferase HHAT isoform X2 [Synchiropus splendidus]
MGFESGRSERVARADLAGTVPPEVRLPAPMTSKPPHPLLPRTEVALYWLLSLGAHLYSFYHLHKFSKVHERALERAFQLEPGLVKGFRRDASDFEWTFWTEWAKKSLLWSLTGHAVVSRLTSIAVPKLRMAALTVYGVVAAAGVLGSRGVLVLLLHLSLSFCVAQLKTPALCWSCNLLLLLSTLHLHELQELQRGWYQTEEEFYLLLFSVAVCGLRFISFSLDHCWSPRDGGALLQLGWLLSYTFYHPLFYNGPIITYSDYVHQMQRPAAETKSGVTFLLLRAARLLLWWCIAECMIHVMYMHAIQSSQTYLEMLPPWALGGLALALVQFFYVKYLVLFGLPSMLATLDGVVPPELPRCVSIMYSFTGMWRHFDKGLYRWLIRYIYLPLGGSRHGLLHKLLSSGLTFGFVCFWHGGHDYLQYWALMNWAGLLLETGFKSFFSLPWVQGPLERRVPVMMRRRGLAFLSSFSTALLILSNLVFLGGIHVGTVFWRRVFLRGWSSLAPPMLLCLYCFAQVGLDWTSQPP